MFYFLIIFYIVAENSWIFTGTTKTNPFSLQNKKKQFKNDLQNQCGIEWQGKYIRKHHEAIANPSSNDKYLVYLCGGKDYGCGGYGNRLNAIASLLLLAVLTNRVFLIDWTGTGISLQDYFTPNKINWNITAKNGRRNYWGVHRGKNTLAARRPFERLRDFKQFIVDTDFDVYLDKKVEVVTTMWYFAGYLKNNMYHKRKLAEMQLGNRRFSWIGCAVDFLFTKTKYLEDRFQHARKSLGMGLGEPFIGVHIRIGDKAFGKVTKKSGTRTKDYMKLINCSFSFKKVIISQNPRLPVRIFLATDDVILKRSLQERFRDIQTVNIIVEHINKPSKEGMMGTLLDHLLLAECDFLVLSSSTFGKTAAGMTLHSAKSYVFGERCAKIYRSRG